VRIDELREAVERLVARDRPPREDTLPVVDALLAALESGQVRAATPADGGWKVNAWVKQGILLAFRAGQNVSRPVPPVFCFRDRDTLPTWGPSKCGRDVRIVPGGTTVRRGAFLGEGVVVMPPAYVNVGAYVGAGSMVDSHALVGSCAQIGKGVHLSAAAQIGGVLEPIGALPVILEDGVFVGGGVGVYEGTRVQEGAVLAPGVTLTRAVPLYDTVRETVYRADGEGPLVVPARAVVVPGSRPAAGSFAGTHGLQVQAPLIVKYRDGSTDAALELERALR
jgi:2,3,4,5-tetrahydropyridine-2-carboxylate N-succinyltransferase